MYGNRARPARGWHTTIADIVSAIGGVTCIVALVDGDVHTTFGTVAILLAFAPQTLLRLGAATHAGRRFSKSLGQSLSSLSERAVAVAQTKAVIQN
jgi:hypothetical protein